MSIQIKLCPIRLRILWPSKFHNDRFYISMSETLDEENNIEAYCKEAVIKVIKLIKFYFKEKHSENFSRTEEWG